MAVFLETKRRRINKKRSSTRNNNNNNGSDDDDEDKLEVARSSVKLKTLNPRWGEELVLDRCPVPITRERRQLLKLAVYVRREKQA